MPSRPEFIYWDSSAFLSYINAYQERISVLDAILDDVHRSNGAKKIVTSILAKIEVAASAQEYSTRELSIETERKIEALWNDSSVIGLIELHNGIALQARELMRKVLTQGWSLKPADAIHLASAQWLGVTEVQTYDDQWPRYSTIIGCKICEPHAMQPRLDF